MTETLATSRYNFAIPLADGHGVFNASTGGALRLEGPDAETLAGLLCGPRVEVAADTFDEPFREQLKRNGILVQKGLDEVAEVRARYWAARSAAPISLLVTTTMDCNLGCYYCYERRTGHELRPADVDELVAFAAQRLDRSGKRSLHVDWYGGEPLLNAEFLEAASIELQAMCAKRGATYHSSIVSNGTLWPEDVGGFVARHRIRQVQISFDGLPARHDRSRRYRRIHAPADGRSSFATAARLVDRLLAHTRVDVRFNASPTSAADLPEFLRSATDRGWFSAPFRCVVMVARLAPYSERSQFMRERELDATQFDDLQEVARRSLPAAAQDDQDIVNGFPHPKTSVCGAIAADSAVYGADGLEYRCGLQVGETHRAVGHLTAETPPPDTPSFADKEWWDAFDPTLQDTCSRCSFLPLCWGGCPKHHLEGSRVDLDREGAYWRTNLPDLLQAGFGETSTSRASYTVADQFRDGPPPLPQHSPSPDEVPVRLRLRN